MTRTDPGRTDPFGTDRIRATVLDIWTRAPARFREDANAEELLSIGYAGRVCGELAANGADAARAAGERGRVAIALRDDVLCVANTGAPLDASGVAAMASLRASAKRETDQVGHFGVGFTAVRALADEIAVISTSGAIHFSVADTAGAIAAAHCRALDDEVARRAGTLPALRLPWPGAGPCGDGPIPDGFTTEIRLKIRDPADRDRLAASLTAELAEDLLWALPDLDGVIVGHWTVERQRRSPGRATMQVAGPDGTTRRDYRTHTADGEVPPAALVDRPVEQRDRSRWRITWVVPADGRAARRHPVGAPTPTDEMLTLPARLISTLPVDETRGRIAPGPLTDFLVERAADAYCALVRSLEPARRAALLPVPEIPSGDLDAALRDGIGHRLATIAFLDDAAGVARRPNEIRMIAGLATSDIAPLAEALPGLIAWPDSPDTLAALRSLGAQRLPTADVTAALAQLSRPVPFWHDVYDALAGLPVDQLADLPVPSASGGRLIGARDVILPAAAGDAADLIARTARAVPGLRIAAPELDHPLLRRLGAGPATAAGLLAAPPLHAEIRRRIIELDETDPEPDDLDSFAQTILDLLAAAPDGPAGARTPALREVLLTDREGEPWPAGTLLLPDAPLHAVLAPDADLPVVGDVWIERYGADLLRRLGVRETFALWDYPLPRGPGRAGPSAVGEAELPDLAEWWDAHGDAILARAASADGPGYFPAVADLDAVDTQQWPAALALLAADPEISRSLTARGTDAASDTASYTAWWLSRFARIGGTPIRTLRTCAAADLDGLYETLDLPPVATPQAGRAADADAARDEIAAALGALTSLADAAAYPGELLARWADPNRTPPAALVPAVTARLVAALADHDLDLPDGVRTLAGTVIPAARAAVLDRPDLAQLLDPAILVAGGTDPVGTAAVLDLDLASERHRIDCSVAGAATRLGDIAAAARALGRCRRGDLADVAVTVDPDLTVRPDGGAARRVAWWIDGDRYCVDGTPAGIGRAVAYLADRWADRYLLAAVAAGDAQDRAEDGFG